MNVFSHEWAQAYRDAINANTAYRTASAGWQEGAIALVLRGEAHDVGVWLDLLKGECLGAESVTLDDAHARAAFVIEADTSTWQEVLGGKLQPLMGIMRGKLRLTKGSMARLLPHTKAANELVACAQSVPTTF
jgi:putative sterol carrier protein